MAGAILSLSFIALCLIVGAVTGYIDIIKPRRETMSQDVQHRRWCLWLFESIREEGIWSVPRSGLTFRKRKGRLELFETIPWMEEMPISKEQFKKQQEAEFDEIRKQFGAAGIAVVK